MTKEFDRLMDAQEALRLWYREHPSQEAPEFMRKELEAAQKAYEEARKLNMNSVNYVEPK